MYMHVYTGSWCKIFQESFFVPQISQTPKRIIFLLSSVNALISYLCSLQDHKLLTQYLALGEHWLKEMSEIILLCLLNKSLPNLGQSFFKDLKHCNNNNLSYQLRTPLRVARYVSSCLTCIILFNPYNPFRY